MAYRFSLVLILFILFVSPAFGVEKSEQPKQKEKLTKADVKIHLPKSFKNLNDKQKEQVRKIVAELEGSLYTWATLPIDLPETAFDPEQGQIITLGRLFKEPSSNEVSKLGGEDFTPEQIETIRQEALYVVDSKDYPGQKHIWKLHFIIQKGRRFIEIVHDQHKEDGLRHLTVSIPARVFGESPVSMRRGLRNIFQGTKEILSLFIGLPEKSRTYFDAEVEKIVEREKKAYVLENGNPEPITDLRLLNLSESESLDLLYNVRRIRSDADLKFNQELPNLLPQIEEYVKKFPEDQREQVRVNQIALAKQNIFFKMLATDKKLNSNPATFEIGQTLARHAVAIHIVMAQENNYREVLEYEREKIAAEILEKNPRKKRILEEYAALEAEGADLSRWKLSRRRKIQKWLEEKTAKRAEVYYQENVWKFYDLLPAELGRHGLDQEAELLRRELKFMKEKAPQIKAELKKQKEANGEVAFKRRLWFRRIESKVNARGERTFHTVKYATTVIDTGKPFWRIRVLFRRMFTWFNNGLHRIIVDNFYNGPVGFRSAVGKEPFYKDFEVDRNTGERTGEKRETVRSKLAKNKEKRQAIHEKYLNDPSTGMFGKKLERLGLFFTNDLKRGVGYPLAIGVGQPIATVGNAAVSAAGSVGMIVWSPIASILGAGFNILINDADGSKNGPLGAWFPLLSRLLANVGVKGTGETLASVAGTTIYHPTMAFLHLGPGLVRKPLRLAYDAAWRDRIAKSGKIPNKEKWYARRIAGPGLTSEYFYQVSPELLAVAMKADVELLNLNRYHEKTKNLIEQPGQHYERAVKVFKVIFGDIGDRPKKDIVNSAHENSRRLQDTTRPMREFYEDLLRLDNGLEIKLTRSDLETAIKQAAAVLRSHFETAYPKKKQRRHEIKLLFQRMGLKNGDWIGLAKKRIAVVFGEQILEPMEDSDERLRLIVKDNTIDDYAEALDTGNVPEDLDRAKVHLPKKAEPLPPVVRSQLPVVTSDRVCAWYLTGKIK